MVDSTNFNTGRVGSQPPAEGLKGSEKTTLGAPAPAGKKSASALLNETFELMSTFMNSLQSLAITMSDEQTKITEQLRILNKMLESTHLYSKQDIDDDNKRQAANDAIGQIRQQIQLKQQMLTDENKKKSTLMSSVTQKSDDFNQQCTKILDMLKNIASKVRFGK